MKKLVFVAIATIISATAVNAQTVKFGAKAGVNFANLNGDTGDILDVKMRTSFHLGGVAEIMFTDKLSFQPELLYSAQGSTYEFDEMGINVTGALKLDYLNIPLMGKYYVAEGFSVQAGPQLGFLLSAKSKFDVDGDTQEEDVKDSIKGIDFGLNIGVGYKLPSGLFFDARYNMGLSNVNDPDDIIDDKNAVIQLSVGFSF